MKNPIFDLLLNPSGTIDRRAYLAAIILTLVIIGIFQASLSFDILSSHITHLQFGNSEDVFAYHIFDNLVWIFTPTLIPAQFLIFYSVLVATIKRSRALELSKFTTVILAFINFYFFSLLSKIHLIANYTFNTGSEIQQCFISQEVVLYLSLTFLILGLLINCFFIFNSRGKCSNASINTALIQSKLNKPYNQFGYLFFTGKLILINILIISTVGLSIYLFPTFFKDIINDLFRNQEIAILSITIIYSAVFFGLYLHATAKRLNDAGYKTYILVSYITFLIFISGIFAYTVNLPDLKVQFLSLFLGASKFFFNIIVSSQIIPFLIMAKSSDKQPKSD